MLQPLVSFKGAHLLYSIIRWHDPADEMAAQLALFNSDEDLSVASSSQVALQKPVPVKKSPEGKWTVDGVYFFATYKELQQAWKDADVVCK